VVALIEEDVESFQDESFVRRGMSLTYQQICYVAIQAKGLSFSTMLGKNWVCQKGRRDFFAARMETQTWVILTAVSSGTS
jgi:hypothetical protein